MWIKQQEYIDRNSPGTMYPDRRERDPWKGPLNDIASGEPGTYATPNFSDGGPQR